MAPLEILEGHKMQWQVREIDRSFRLARHGHVGMTDASGIIAAPAPLSLPKEATSAA